MKETEWLIAGRSVTLIRAANEPWEREGARTYDVYLDRESIGEVKRYRERYPYKSLGGNVALFRSRWSWKHSRSRRNFDTRKEAVAALVEEFGRE